MKLTSANILSQTLGEGGGGEILIKANHIDLLNGSAISTSTLKSDGQGGNINIEVTDTLELSGSRQGFVGGYNNNNIFENVQSGFGSVTFGGGNGGTIEITANNLVVNGASIGTATMGSGKAGNMKITVNNLSLKGGGTLTNGNGAFIGEKLFIGTGNGGETNVSAKEKIIIEGRNQIYSSSITSNTFSSGKGGNINIETDRLVLGDKGTISANSIDINQGGIGPLLREKGFLKSSINIDNNGTGEGGSINIQADNIILHNDSNISANSIGILQLVKDGYMNLSVDSLLIGDNLIMDGNIKNSQLVGNAGNIKLTVGQLSLTNQAAISANAQASAGGNINLTSPGYLYLKDSYITTNVKEKGNGGNIKLNPEFIVLDSGKILSLSQQGDGGKINISLTGLYNFSQGNLEEFINAKSSGGGIDGEVNINYADTRLTENLLALSTEFDASNQLQTPCGAKLAENLSSLVMVPSEGVTNAPNDLLPNSPYC
ncbi:MAG: hypothetical protein HC877_02075 [Thioploca sp.]|nr:hypothetical protein [Thioploca sp.]